MLLLQSLIVAPRFEVPEKVLAERAHRAALEHMFDAFAMYEAATVAVGRVDVRSYCKGLRDSGAVVSLPPITGKGRVYPAFQFTADLNVLPVVASINQLLGADSEPVAVASWWSTPNAQLGGVAPFELVQDPGAHELLEDVARLEQGIDN